MTNWHLICPWCGTPQERIFPTHVDDFNYNPGCKKCSTTWFVKAAENRVVSLSNQYWNGNKYMNFPNDSALLIYCIEPLG